MATVLAEHFGSIDAMIAASEEELSEVMEIGPVIAASVYEFLARRFRPRDDRRSAERRAST